MDMMTAFRLLDWQRAELVEVPVPEPAPGEVLLRVAGAGLCHSDLHFMQMSRAVYDYSPPFTLGHETAGWVHSLGAGVDDLEIGEAVIAAAHNWCAQCEFCLRGMDNHCLARRGGAGYGSDGGLAEFVTLPRNVLVPLGDLDPRYAGPLADAGATAHHAVAELAPKLQPGSTVVVLGAGGLGGYAIQFLRLLTPSHVIAADIVGARRDGALELGANQALHPDQLEGIRADAVLDFVGSDESIATAVGCAQPGSSVVILGAGAGAARVGWGSVPAECSVYLSLGNTLADLWEVVTYARRGLLSMQHEIYKLGEVDSAYARMRAGEINGRAIVVMD
jgi:propanol-preferring alcohol dehydrogenase